MTANVLDLVTLDYVKTLMGIKQGADSLVESLAPQTLTDTATCLQADRTNFTTTEVIFEFGTVVTGGVLSATNKITCGLQESDNGTTWTTVPASSISGTLPVLTSDADDAKTYSVYYLGVKKYIKPTIVFSATPPDIPASVLIRLVPAGPFDATLQGLITAASMVIANLTMTDFIQQERSEPYPWDEIVGALLTTQPPANFVIGATFLRRIKLRHRPIVSVTSITDPAGNTTPAANYTIQKNRGVLEGTFLPPFDVNGRVSYWQIVYQSGLWASTAAITDASIMQACAETVKDWFSRRSGPRLISKAIGDVSLAYTHAKDTNDMMLFPVPGDALAMLAPYMMQSF